MRMLEAMLGRKMENSNHNHHVTSSPFHYSFPYSNLDLNSPFDFSASPKWSNQNLRIIAFNFETVFCCPCVPQLYRRSLSLRFSSFLFSFISNTTYLIVSYVSRSVTQIGIIILSSTCLLQRGFAYFTRMSSTLSRIVRPFSMAILFLSTSLSPSQFMLSICKSDAFSHIFCHSVCLSLVT